jgi:hypothetical protein
MASSQDFMCLRRHETYYIPSGDLNFLVERVSFRVHRYFFERESYYFREKLAGPNAPGVSNNGEVDGTAIIMDDVKSADFARFLWVFYNPKYSIYNATWDDWVAILGLAHKWDFPSVTELCVRELQMLDAPPVERVHVYHKHDLDRNLLVPQYAELCSREEPITLEEGFKLGLETSLLIARARETARSNSQGGTRSPLPAHVKEQDMVQMVKEMFNLSDDLSRPQSPNSRNDSGPGEQGSPSPQPSKSARVASNGAVNGNSSMYTTGQTNGTNNSSPRSNSITSQNGALNGVNGYGNGSSNSGALNGNSSNGVFGSISGILSSNTPKDSVLFDQEPLKPADEPVKARADPFTRRTGTTRRYQS